jgi:hypothetical protein
MDILLYSPVSVPLTAILERTMRDHYDIQYITDMLLSPERDVLYKFLIMNTISDASSLIIKSETLH